MSEHFSNRIWQDIAAELNHPDWRSLKKTYEDARRIITAGEPDVVATLQQRLTAAVARIAELECRLRCRAARGKTDAWDSTGQPAPTQSDPDGYQKG